MKDGELVQRCIHGDGEAFEVLVHRYATLAKGVAYTIVGDHHGASDVAQEAFFKAYRALATLEDPQKFRRWLMGIVRRAAIDWLRKRKEVVAPQEEDTAWEQPTPHPSPTEEVEQKELRHRVRQILSELPLEYQEILILKYAEGLSYQEISAKLEISVSAVESKLFRARKLLKEKWDFSTLREQTLFPLDEER